MRILISGCSGFIGKALSSHWLKEGKEVVPLVRSKNQKGLYFSFENRLSDYTELENFDVVVHLSGENIASSRWTEKKKFELIKSRVDTTKRLIQALETLKKPPKQFLCASGLSYFGDRNNEPLIENSSPGEGFLARLCIDWEAASISSFCPSTQLRFGMVLGPYGNGSALDKMIPLAKWGLGATLGSGNQFIPWIHIDDVVRAIDWALEKNITGPINFCSPNAVTQKTFAKTLSEELKRPFFCKIPSWALRIIIGEMADELLLASTKAHPEKLLKSGFSFLSPSLKEALQKTL